MKIRNLVTNYLEASKKDNPQGYSELFSELFKHYFTLWSNEKFAFFDDMTAIKEGERDVLDRLEFIREKLEKSKIPIDDLGLVLFVGQNVSNGHSAKLDGKWWTWIPVEAYRSAFQVDVFLTHEVLHAVQYHAHPELYFETKAEKNLVSRQIITEGFATFASMQIMNLSKKEALWADILSEEEYGLWIGQYEERKHEVLDFVLENWNGDAGEIFQAGDKNDLFRFRVGYLLALEAYESISENFSLPDLLEKNGGELDALLFNEIKKERDG